MAKLLRDEGGMLADLERLKQLETVETEQACRDVVEWMIRCLEAEEKAAAEEAARTAREAAEAAAKAAPEAPTKEEAEEQALGSKPLGKGMEKIVAALESDCAHCGKTIPKGEKCMWSPGSGLYHVDCVQGA